MLSPLQLLNEVQLRTEEEVHKIVKDQHKGGLVLPRGCQSAAPQPLPLYKIHEVKLFLLKMCGAYCHSSAFIKQCHVLIFIMCT